MQTEILKVDPKNPEKEKLEKAAEVIREGGLVAFPTETVYGLGANALDKKAVTKIFRAKQRPMDNPLIVHISDMGMARRIAELNEVAEKLAKEFFPGPLTLVVPKKEVVPAEVTAGLDTVAIRMPSHPIALKLIEAAKVPIAAPSANLAGKPSPTKAEHVIEDLYGRIDLIIDGGETNIGVESTVLDTTTLEILRPGGLPIEEIRKLVDVKVFKGKVEVAKSPGMKYRHYAPDAELIVFYGKRDDVVEKIKKLSGELVRKGLRVGIAATNLQPYSELNAEVIELGNSIEEVAKNLFSCLRELDKKADVIIAEGVEEKGIGLAVMNRLMKASAGKFYRV
ncbi:MAG: threonylcarbamoyl-AMP synthase [Archaeoglobus sp.]|nr:threonylcarbamoyl-AMP synthase [Archaeoglobus sp.]